MNRKLATILGLLAVPFFVGGIAYSIATILAPGQQWTWFLVTAGVALLVVLVILIVAWWRGRSKASSLESSLALGSGKFDSKGEVEALRKNWKESVAKLKGSAVGGGGRRALAALPWYVIIGAPASGKSTLLRQSGIDFPVGDAGIRGLQGTRNCDWWFSNVGIFLDTAGRYISDESAAEWGSFLELVRKHRGGSPINGVIVAIPAKDLVETDAAARDLDAKRIRARLDELIDHLGVNFPVWIVVTKVDLVGGFVEFFGQADQVTRQQMMGWAMEPGEGARFQRQAFDQSWARMIHRLREVRPAMVAAAKLRDRPAAFGFPDEMGAVGDPLGEMLQKIFAPNVYQETPLLRGVFITSATQQGTPLQRAAARVREMLGAPAVDADAQGLVVKNAYFVRDLMHERVLVDQGMTWTTQAEVERGRHRRIGINLVGGSVALLLLFFAIANGIAAKKNLAKRVDEVVQAEAGQMSATERLEKLRSAYREFPEQPGLVAIFQGDLTTRDKVRERELGAYRRHVLDAVAGLAAGRAGGAAADAPTAEQVVAAVEAHRNASLLRPPVESVAAVVESMRPRAPGGGPLERTGAPLPALDVPGAGAKPDPVAEAEKLAERLRKDPNDPKEPGAPKALEPSPEARTVLAEAKVTPLDPKFAFERFLVAVWRNHDSLPDAERQAWVGRSREEAAARAKRYLAAQSDVVTKWEDLVGRRLREVDGKVERLRAALKEADDARVADVPDTESLRRPMEALAAFRDAGAEAPSAPAAPPDWKGVREVADALARAEAAGARIVDPAEYADFARKVAETQPKDGAAVASPAAVERSKQVSRLAAAVAKWLETAGEQDPEAARRALQLTNAVDSLRAAARSAGDRLLADAEPDLDLLFPDEKDAARRAAWKKGLRGLGERYVYARMVERFEANDTGSGFGALARRVTLKRPSGDRAVGRAELAAALRDMLDVRNAPGEPGPAYLPVSVRDRVEMRAKEEVTRLVDDARRAWDERIRRRIRPLESSNAEAYLRQFHPSGEEGRIRILANEFDAAWGAATDADPSIQDVLDDPANSLQYALLRPGTVQSVWTAVEPLVVAPGDVSASQYATLAGHLRARRWSQAVPSAASAGEQDFVRMLQQAVGIAETDALTRVAQYLNGRWAASYPALQKFRLGRDELTEPERAQIRAVTDDVNRLFSGSDRIHDGRLRLIPSVHETLRAFAASGGVVAEEKPITMTVRKDQLNLPVRTPKLRVTYSETGRAGPPQSATFDPSSASAVKGTGAFTWIPRKGLRFEIVATDDGGTDVEIAARSGADCVVETIDDGDRTKTAATSTSIVLEWPVQPSGVVRLVLTVADAGEASRLRSILAEHRRAKAGGPAAPGPAPLPPDRCVEGP